MFKTYRRILTATFLLHLRDACTVKNNISFVWMYVLYISSSFFVFAMAASQPLYLHLNGIFATSIFLHLIGNLGSEEITIRCVTCSAVINLIYKCLEFPLVSATSAIVQSSAK